MTPLRFAMLGAGFWARYQLAAWQEVAGAKCVAVYNRTLAKAQRLADEFGVPRATDNADELLQAESLDFVDIVTDVEAHRHFVDLAARHRLPAICQKPLAASLAEAEQMAAACRAAGVPLLVHENFRWQRPIREVQRILDERRDRPAVPRRIDMISGFSSVPESAVPARAGSVHPHRSGHAHSRRGPLSVRRSESLYCQTHRVHADIRGEDVATVVTLHNERRTTVTCNLAYAENPLERECFPQTLLFVEGSAGSLELVPDYGIRVTTSVGTTSSRHPPPPYAWVDPAYAVVQSSMVDCHRDLLRELPTAAYTPETTADDNLRTLARCLPRTVRPQQTARFRFESAAVTSDTDRGARG